VWGAPLLKNLVAGTEVKVAALQGVGRSIYQTAGFVSVYVFITHHRFTILSVCKAMK
jgi:hypothetical protein